MAKLSQLTIPVKNPSTGAVTSQTFDLTGSGGGGQDTNFKGKSMAEWDALTQEEQDQYDTVDLTDDYTDVTDELETLSNKVNNDIVDQTAGKTITLKYSGLVGYANNTNQPAVFCPFPFLTKNTNYTVSISAFVIDGVGSPSNLHVYFKNKTGVTIVGTSTMTYRSLFGTSNIEITVTFA